MMVVERDSPWGWFVLFCVVCSQLVLGGTCLSGGLFYATFSETFASDPVETSWLCSLPITMWFLTSPIGSFLTNRFGYRTCAFTGGILAATGLSLSYLAPNFYFLFFSHGFLTGLGLGINYNGCLAGLNIYFDRYKTIATGIASIGHNLGLVIYAEILVVLEEEFGWRGMMLILGGVTFHQCACACVMFPVKVEMPESVAVFENNKTFHSKRRNINLSVFRKLSFDLYCASNVFLNFSQGIYILHLPSYSKDAGFTQTDFGTVLMSYGISNIVGKVFLSFLGQHPKVDAMAVYAFSLTATGIGMGLTPVFLTKTGMILLAGIVGFFFCVTGALLPAVIHRLVGFSRFADGVGLSMPFKATGNLIGGPTAGVLLTLSGTYSSSFYLAGVSMIFSSFLMIQPIIYSKTKRHEHGVSDLFKVGETEVLKKEDLTTNCDTGQMNVIPLNDTYLTRLDNKLIEIEIEDRKREFITEE